MADHARFPPGNHHQLMVERATLRQARWGRAGGTGWIGIGMALLAGKAAMRLVVEPGLSQPHPRHLGGRHAKPPRFHGGGGGWQEAAGSG